MKKAIAIFILLAFTLITYSQPKSFTFKAHAIGGKILYTNKNLENIDPRPTFGLELDIEFPSWNQYPWQQYWGRPTLGLGFTYLNLGDNKVLGQAFAIYPYLLIHCVKANHFQLNYKFGGGLSFFNKNYYRCDTLPSHFYNPTSNISIGSILNVYLNTALNLNFPITKNFAMHAEIGYSHMSNGSMIQPNGGLNMIYASLGASYMINNNRSEREIEHRHSPLPYKWSLNITASGGYRELYYMDVHGYGVGSLHIGTTYNACNWYAFGGGFDMFYDGAFNQQGYNKKMTQEEITKQQTHTKFNRYIITNEKAYNKFRVGISINNEFIIGRITALLDWGIYLYDPIRLAYADENGNKHTKRPILYKYNINKEDGWNYFRLGVRCRVWDNLYLQATVKTHLSKAEMIEWGIGYKIPWRNKHSYIESNKSNIFHY